MSNNSYHYRFDINPNGEKTSVPKPWPAKFMYYLECVFAIIQIDIPLNILIIKIIIYYQKKKNKLLWIYFKCSKYNL